jgi:hypothetical protein
MTRTQSRLESSSGRRLPVGGAAEPGLAWRPGCGSRRRLAARWNRVLRLAVCAVVFTAAIGVSGRPPAAWAASFKLVAHPRVTADSLGTAECSRVFLKKTTTWADGSAIVPVDLPVAARVRELFSQAVHKKSASAVDAYWQKQIFSGRDVPPLTKTTEAEVIAFVRSTQGAVGYVSADAAVEGVKVIGLD